jgi:hypothetical protein
MGKFIDLTGKTFGRLTVIDRSANNKNGHTRWNCMCDCGNATIADAANIKNGNTKSCGCAKKDSGIISGKSKAIDLSGMVFSRLTVIRRYETITNRSYWECLCDCGRLTVVASHNLRRGTTSSCGCLRRTANGLAWTIEHKRKWKADYILNPVIAFKERTRSLIRCGFKRKFYIKNTKTQEILGCTFEEFKIHIESQFTDGMSWEVFDKIHIDHITPLASAMTIEDVIRLNKYTNLHPLWAIDNLKKGSKLDYNVYGEVGRHVVNPAMIEDSVKIA